MKRSRLLILLVVLLCAALVYAWMATPRQRRVSTPATGRIQTNTSIEQSLSAVAEFEELDFTGSAASAYRTPVRNLFAALYQPPKVLPKPKKKPRPRPKPVPKADVRTSVDKPLQPTGPPPMKPLELFGFLIRESRYMFFLSSTEGDVFLVKEGDVFADNLVIDRVTTEEIHILKKDTGQQTTIALGEVKSQRLPTMRVVSDRPVRVIPKKPELSVKKTTKQNDEDSFIDEETNNED